MSKQLHLLVDDMRDFRDLQQPTGELIVCRNSVDALSQLAAHKKFDSAWLDHDLGGYDTIRPVIDWILENKPVIGRIYVITSNPPARQMMLQTLLRAGYYVYAVQAGEIFTVHPKF